jgi:hypothetical protein
VVLLPTEHDGFVVFGEEEASRVSGMAGASYCSTVSALWTSQLQKSDSASPRCVDARADD